MRIYRHNLLSESQISEFILAIIGKKRHIVYKNTVTIIQI